LHCAAGRPVDGPDRQELGGLGETLPHWSVLANEHFLPAHINATEEEFFATGEHDRNRLFETVRRVGRGPAEFKVAHEYGCGLGRITNHLSERFERVIACEVSRPHLDLACARSARIGRTNIDYRLAELPSFGMDEPLDLWFTIIVLQHNPPPIMTMILRRALALLRSGGLAVFQLPTYSSHYRLDVEEYLASPVPPSGLELHFLPQWILFRLYVRLGARPLKSSRMG
jgi:SAM-dependent methyltransferase